ncbi:trimeric LpxA-like protein [Rickenella mellea]|uniref:Trimeric LpxA-like protein n=1 Tax=Rickenella mellea TaxID=50990 RepID=A0A4Y7QAD7_9AGAM|nr:trimeric LpxA-like protein [Rickenella mellea]
MNSEGESLAVNALSERQKSFQGLPYNAADDPDLIQGRLRARKYLKAYNDYPPAEYKPNFRAIDYFGPDERFQILADLFGIPLEKVKSLPICIEPPFYCDYGTNIEFKGEFYSNFNFTVLGTGSFNCAKVTIGSRVLCAPNVHLYAATHSVEVSERRAGLERAYPITIGDDVWIGGNVSIIGPCTIGNGVTIAAGSTVRGIVPDNVVFGGNPGRILKKLEPPPPLTQAETEMEPGARVSVP